MDIGTGLALFGSAQIIAKILGPTSDYIGKEIESFTQKRVNNIKSIFNKASRKLGSKIDSKGSVNPKVLSIILNEGSFCEDELSQEYFGGVLAGSRNEISRDNRGATLLLLINQLSIYQIRAHYIFYSIVNKLYKNKGFSIATNDGRDKMETFYTLKAFSKSMNLEKNEYVDTIIPHILTGLAKENLIGEQYSYGKEEFIKELYKEAKEAGLIFLPTIFGVELFLWVHGKSNLHIGQFFDKNIEFEKIKEIEIAEEYEIIKK